MKLHLFLFLLLGLFPGCALLIEEDLTDKEVFINIPVDDAFTTHQSQTFWWDPVEGTLKCNLQIFLVDSNLVEEIIADTNLSQNKFVISLNPGTYNWRVRGWNNYSSTDFYSQSLTIVESPSLLNQEMVLRSPVDFSFKNYTTVLFHWYPLSMASEYVLEIRNNNWQGSLAFPRVSTRFDTIAINLQEGNYQWGVMALNDISTTEFTVRNLCVDTKSPPTSLLSIPQDSAVITTGAIDFSWTHTVPEDENFLIDSLIVSSDSLFRPKGIILSKGVTSKEYSFEIDSNGKYFWRVKSIDKAGNISDWSKSGSFYIEL
jgi:hypothetical protein